MKTRKVSFIYDTSSDVFSFHLIHPGVYHLALTTEQRNESNMLQKLRLKGISGTRD